MRESIANRWRPLVPLMTMLITTLLNSPSSAQSYSVEVGALRTLYLGSATDESLIDLAFSVIENLPRDPKDDALIQAFDGALVVMQAKHAFWPSRKLAYVRRGLRDLDAAVDRDPENAEIRYLRLISCYYLPALFKRKWSVKEDFAALAQNISGLADTVPPDYVAGLLQFVLDKGQLDEQSNERLRRQLQTVPTVSNPAGR